MNVAATRNVIVNVTGSEQVVEEDENREAAVVVGGNAMKPVSVAAARYSARGRQATRENRHPNAFCWR